MMADKFYIDWRNSTRWARRAGCKSAANACLPHCRAWGGGSVSVLICQVCSINPAKGVASCTFGPMSLAYCSECLAHKAEPLWAFDYTFDEVSENGEGMADWWLQMTTWKDGQYITWPDYVAQRQAHPTTGATP